MAKSKSKPEGRRLTPVLVVIEPSHRADMKGMETALRREGLIVRETLELVGQINGEVAEEAIPQLQKVRGVAFVRPERTVRVPSGEGDE